MLPQGRQKRHGTLGGDLEPLSVRALQAAGALSLLLILVVLNSLLNPRGGESPLDPNPVAAAAERTAEVPGMRMQITMRFIPESSPEAVVTGSGVYNGETDLAEIAYDGTTSQGQELRFDAILSEDGWFFRYPQLTGKLPEGKEWIKLEGLPGQKDLSAPGFGSPDESLAMLRSTGSVHRLGQARVGQTDTAHYRVTMTAAGIVAGLRAQGKDELAEQVEGAAAEIVGPVRADVFVDGAGILRRMRIVSTALTGGHRVTTEMRMDFSDFGIEPAIAPPDDARVLDITPAVEARMEALGESS